MKSINEVCKECWDLVEEIGDDICPNCKDAVQAANDWLDVGDYLILLSLVHSRPWSNQILRKHDG